MCASKSSPPNVVSPLVDLTSNTPSPNSKIDTSKVPPPKSYTATVFASFLSKPYANAAAVGSLIIFLHPGQQFSPHLWLLVFESR